MFSSLEKTVMDPDNTSGLPVEEIIQLKMDADNENKEHAVDLGLALGYSGQCIPKALNNDSGAGANAGSRVDMTFVATNPLSELVWSPHKGLSLKCADSSVNEKRTSLLWGTGPSNRICSPLHSITDRKTIPDEPRGKGNLVTSEATVCVKNETGETDFLTCSLGSNAGIITVYGSSHQPNAGPSGNNDELMAAVQVSAFLVNQEQDQGESKEKSLHAPPHIPIAITSETRGEKGSGSAGTKHECMADSLSFKMNETEPDMAQIEPLTMQLKKRISSNPDGGIGDDGSGVQTMGMKAVFTTKVPPVKQYDTPNAPVLNSTAPFRIDEGLALATEEESNNEMKTPGSTSNPLEKPESAAENDLRTQTVEYACGDVSKTTTSASNRDFKFISQQDEEMLLKAKALPTNNSPNKSGLRRLQRKGKGKALSDGDRSGRKSNKEDESDESVESCNSAALFSTGKKRWGYEQQLITGSKRIREQIDGCPGSTSFVRQDSSFMSWISNMMKGLSKSSEDKTPLALTFAHPNHDGYDQKLVTCNKSEDVGCRNMGFQSIFQSLYCPTPKVQQPRTLIADNQTGEGSKEPYLANKLCDVKITPVVPIACHGENKSFTTLQSNEKFDQSNTVNGAGPFTRPKPLSAKFGASQENYNTSSVENRSASNLMSGTKKDGFSSSSSSLGKRKTNSAENNDSDPPSEGKRTLNFGYKSNLLGSLWVTRFCPKNSTILNVDHCNQNTDGSTELSTECMRLAPYSQNRCDSFKGLKILETREYCTEEPLTIVGAELQSSSGGMEVSFGSPKNSAHYNQKSIYKLNTVLPSKRFKCSGAMASVFARRLDALKHIRALNGTNNEACPTSTCFFCGIRGHSIHDCPEIKEAELEDLLRNSNSYFGAEEPPCFCIRCFQLNHWAVACPNILKRQNQLECGASLVNRCSSGMMLCETGDKRNQELLGSKENPPQLAATFGVCSGRKHMMLTGSNLDKKRNGNMAAVKLYPNSNPVRRYSASSSAEINSKGSQIIPLSNFVNPQISDVPKRIFDAIKRLRLSRVDILKWMDSVSPFSNLNGFFLRLRLGKWEEGLGGTGYYVACISGTEKERNSQSSRNPIAVNIGGIKCLVESQYVSNHDFLEDELMAWWGATARAGCKIPSEEDLKVKLEERNRLGL